MNWLLLRGLVRERRHWLDVPDRLAARTRASVLTLDLPGVGTEHRRPSPTTIDGIVADLRERFLATRSQGPWSLFAVSLGGMVALRWGELHPEDFGEIVVCNTSASNLAGPFQRFRPAALMVLLRALPAGPVARQRLILGLVANTPEGQSHAETFAAFAADAPVAVSVLFRQLLAGARAQAPAALRVPLRVLASDGDRLCDPVASRTLATRLGAPLLVHPTAGHDLALDAPEWVLVQLSP